MTIWPGLGERTVRPTLCRPLLGSGLAPGVAAAGPAGATNAVAAAVATAAPMSVARLLGGLPTTLMLAGLV